MPGADPGADDGHRVEMQAKEHLDQLGRRFEGLLTATAALSTGGRPIGIDDLDRAYDRLVSPDRETFRDAQAIVSRAIEENRIGEWIAYAITVSLSAVGLASFAIGAWRGAWLAGISIGVVAEILVYFPIRMAFSIRQENFRMRILATLIDRGGDPKTMALILKDVMIARPDA